MLCPECNLNLSTPHSLSTHVKRCQLKQVMTCNNCDKETRTSCHKCIGFDPNAPPKNFYKFIMKLLSFN